MIETLSILRSGPARWRPFLRGCLQAGLAALGWLVMASATLAQPNSDIDTPGLAVEAMAGWDGVTDKSFPLPLSFSIRNETPANIEAVLTISEHDKHGEVSLGDVYLAPQSSRRVTSIRSMADWEECVATLRQGNKILWRRTLALMSTRVIDPNANLVLFVDSQGRRLVLPGESSKTVSSNQHRSPVAGPKGRPVDVISVPAWQLPLHPGPLFLAQSLVFPEDLQEKDANRTQWQAVARWVCEGGVVFVPHDSKEVIARLIELAPLIADPEIDEGSLTSRRLGLGSIFEYDQKLFGAHGEAMKESIAGIASKLPKDQISSFVDTSWFDQMSQGQASEKRSWLMGLFVIYGLLSGLGTILLFRRPQRQILMFVASVVGGTSLLAGGLGVSLRSSRGDVRWLTVTQAGAGGLIQMGCLELQSAGGLNSKIALRGGSPDIQDNGKPARPYYWWQSQRNYSPFNWQPNRETVDSDIFQIEVPMSPWGRRRCHSTGFSSDSQPLEIDLDFVPKPVGSLDEKDKKAAYPGKFSMKVQSHLPFDIHDAWLVIGASQPSLPEFTSNNPQANYYATWSRGSMSVDGLIDVYHRSRLPQFHSGTTMNHEFESNFVIVENAWEFQTIWPRELRTSQMMQIRLSTMGVPRAWIIGQVKNSPISRIEEDRSDFILQKEVHLFMQEIDLEDLPVALKSPNP